MARTDLRWTGVASRTEAETIAANNTRILVSWTAKEPAHVITEESIGRKDAGDVNLRSRTAWAKCKTHPSATAAEQLALAMLLAFIVLGTCSWNARANWAFDGGESKQPPTNTLGNTVIGLAVRVAITMRIGIPYDSWYDSCI